MPTGFSYTSDEFVSVNRKAYRAIRTTRALFPTHRLRFVGDAGLDDQKVYRQIALVQGEFIIRACHNRTVEVYNDRLDRWETEQFQKIPLDNWEALCYIEYAYSISTA